MKGFEEWARKNEDLLKDITEYLTGFDSFGHFLIGFVVIAVIPAVGEELLFRGILQSQMIKAFGNPHVAIWLAGFLFSFIHFQFYGFIPRMLLGVIFGYLYYWSGNLLVAVLCHFFNNGITILMFYLYQLNMIDVNVEDTEKVPWTMVFPALVLTVGLMYYLRGHLLKNKFEVE